MEETTGIDYFEKILEKNIIICPNCNGSGAVKMTDKKRQPVVRGGKLVTQTCDFCYGYGRMGRVLKECLFRLPDATPPEEPKKNIFSRFLGG